MRAVIQRGERRARDRPVKRDALRHAESRGLAQYGAAERVLAGDVETGLEARAQKPRQRGEERLLILHAIEAADVEQPPWWTFGRRRGTPMKAREVDADRQDERAHATG